MMAWMDKYRPASFRGVPFHVRAAEDTAGRRTVRHEYPQRNVPWIEDMGEAADEFQLDAFVIGNDYMARRDALIQALRQPGSGQLIHPYLGTKQVSLLVPARIRQSTENGGMAEFSLSFIEAGSQNEPSSVTDTGRVLDDRFSFATDSIVGDFSGAFSVDGVLDFVGADALASVTSLLAMPVMSDAMGSLDLIRADPSSVLSALLPENLLSSLYSPALLGAGIVSLISGMSNTTSVRGVVRSPGASSLLNYSLPVLTTSYYTPSREQQVTNRIALENLVVQTAVAKQVTDYAVSDPQTLDEAREVTAEIVDLVDSVIMSDTAGYPTIDAFVQLRTVAVQHFQDKTADLPKSVEVFNQATVPAIVLAHRFYGGSWYERERDVEIVERNNILHPGVIPAGRLVRLLSE